MTETLIDVISASSTGLFALITSISVSVTTFQIAIFVPLLLNQNFMRPFVRSPMLLFVGS